MAQDITLPTVTVTAKRIPKPTDIVGNPLSAYASYTYSCALWWLSDADYAGMTNIGDVSGYNYVLSNNSFVIAEDGGIYTSRRLPTQESLNYYLSDIEFTTTFGPNPVSKSTNMIDGKFKVTEPIGITFIDSLIYYDKFLAAQNGTQTNYTQRPYLLEIQFTGYDDSGNPIPDSKKLKYRCPIRITKMDVKLENSGSSYDISFCNAGGVTFHDEYAYVNTDLTVAGSTVNDFFDPNNPQSFTSQLNKYWAKEAALYKTVPHTYTFNVDPAIGSTTIAYSTSMSLSQVNPFKATIDSSTSTFVVPRGARITEVIEKVLVQSDYIISQLNTKDPELTSADQLKLYQQQVLNTFKITTNIQVSGFDNTKNSPVYNFVHNIGQYFVFDSLHPYGPQLSNTQSMAVKEYDYLYTGKNTEVMKLDIDFDMSWWTGAIGMQYTNLYNATQGGPGDNADLQASTTKATIATVQGMVSGGSTNDSSLKSTTNVPNLTPVRTKIKVTDQRVTNGANIINNPNGQIAADVLQSIYDAYSNMVTVNLGIIGDPTLIKQDDWLYSVNPVTQQNYSSMSQSDFAKSYNHLKTDEGSLLVKVVVNTPIDYDTEWVTNPTGLMTPNVSTKPSMFSGLYEINLITNNLSNGQFTQTLMLSRVMNDVMANAIANQTTVDRTATSAAAQATTNQSIVNATTNGSSSGSGTSSSTYDSTRSP